MPRIPLDTGPSRGVLYSRDPYDNPGSLYYLAYNRYLPDPQRGSGLYARPGMALRFAENPMPGKGQAVISYRTINGQHHNFLVRGGRIYRTNDAATEKVDVTPTQVQYQMWFTNGQGTEPILGDTVDGVTSSASGTVLSVTITSGSFASSTAQGYYLFSAISGTFQAGEDLEVATVQVGVAVAPAVNATIQIDPNATHVYWCAGIDGLVFSDQTNRPWIVTDVTSTPLQGVPIDLDGKGSAWSAFGRPTTYEGSLFFIVKEYQGDPAQGTIAWSRPGLFQVGYNQTDYDYNWTLEQTNGAPLYAILGTNNGLYYFRDQSIGLAAGTPGPDFRTSATSDAISNEVGCTQSATIQVYSQNVFFTDAIGRVWMMQIGGALVDVWTQFRAAIDVSSSRYPQITQRVSKACIEPRFNLYLVAIWSFAPGASAPPVEIHAWDARTGLYVGVWVISTGVSIEAMGVINDRFGAGAFTVLGKAPPVPTIVEVLSTEDLRYLTTEDGRWIGLYDSTLTRQGVAWIMQNEKSMGLDILCEDGEPILCEDEVPIITEDTIPDWSDNDYPPKRTVITDRLGYTEDHVIVADMLTIITQSPDQMQVGVGTTAVPDNMIEGYPVPAASQDGTNRLVCSLNGIQGRGVTVTVDPITADTQHILDRISVKAIPYKASPFEP